MHTLDQFALVSDDDVIVPRSTFPGSHHNQGVGPFPGRSGGCAPAHPGGC